MELTHIDEKGDARMVDISAKPHTAREAVAGAVVRMKAGTLSLLMDGKMPKGDVFAAARIAGIMAAKRTQELIPLCHSLPLDGVSIELTANAEESCVEIRATVHCTYKTGVEMEALTAASVAALTVYDMCKAVDKAMTIDGIRLLKKTGGKSGDYEIG